MSSPGSRPRDSARKTTRGAPVGLVRSVVSKSAPEPGRIGAGVRMAASTGEFRSTEKVLPGEVSSGGLLMNPGTRLGSSTESTLSPGASPNKAKPPGPKLLQGAAPHEGPLARMKSPAVQPGPQIAGLPREGDPGASETKKSLVSTFSEIPSTLSAATRRTTGAEKKIDIDLCVGSYVRMSAGPAPPGRRGLAPPSVGEPGASEK